MKTNTDFINQYLTEMSEIIEKIDRSKIDGIIEALYDTWKNGGTVYLMGNGGSSSTASHLYNDLLKCTITPGKPRLKVINFTDNPALITAMVNDWGFDKLYSEQMLTFAKPGDALVGFSAHGGSGKDKAGLWSQNILAAYKVAQDKGVKMIGFSGYDGGVMKDLCDICVVVPFNNTQHVESFHLAIGHLVANRLIEKIASSDVTDESNTEATACSR